MSLRVAIAIVALVSGLIYANAFGHTFVYDDLPLIVWNPRVQSLDRLAECVTSSYWGETNTGLYRPLVLLSFAANHALDGLETRGYVALNVGLHAGVASLVVLLAGSLGAPRAAAFATGLLFAVHPVHTEAVTWVSGRAELLCAAFSLLALLAHRRGVRERDTPWRWRIAAGVSLLAALLSKEHAITLLAVAPALDVVAPPRARDAGEAKLTRLVPYASLFAAVAVGLGLRALALGGGAFTPRYVVPLDNPLVPQLSSVLGNAYGASSGERLLTATSLIGEALRVLAWPARLSVDYSFAQLPVVRSPWDLRFAVGALVLATVVFGVFALRRRAPVASAGLALLGLTWSVSSNLILVSGTIFAERLLYLPSVGFLLVCGVAWARVHRRHPTAAAGVLVVLVVLCGGRTWVRNGDWTNRRSLWTAAVVASPNSAKAHGKLGILLLEVAEALRSGPRSDMAPPILRAARVHLVRSATIYPESANVTLGMARAHQRLGDHDQAVAAFRRVAILQRGMSESLRAELEQALDHARSGGGS